MSEHFEEGDGPTYSNGADEETDDGLITLTDESGEEFEFEVIDVLEVDGNQYAVLGLLDDGEEAVVLRIELDENGDEYLTYIDDDAEWERVAQAWNDDEDDDDDAGG